MVIFFALFGIPSLLEPKGQILRPGMNGFERRLVLQADAMPTPFVNMQVKRHTRPTQSNRELQAVLHRHS
jgi:hypothetical protein